MNQQINLFNPAFAREKKVFTAKTMVSALGLLLAGCLALYAYGRHSVGVLEQQARDGEEQLVQKKLRHANVMVEFAPRKKSPALAAEVAEAQAELAALDHVTQILARGDFGDSAGFGDYFKALARQSNGEVWITGLTIGAAGKRIGLQGRALDASLVPAYVGRLTREPSLRGRSFGSLDIVRPVMTQAAANGAPAREMPAPFVEFSLQAAGGGAPAQPAQAATLPRLAAPASVSMPAPLPATATATVPVPTAAPAKELL